MTNEFRRSEKFVRNSVHDEFSLFHVPLYKCLSNFEPFYVKSIVFRDHVRDFEKLEMFSGKIRDDLIRLF